MNIPAILQYGLLGLAFLLAYFAFRLLRREQAQESPRPELLRASWIYFLTCILFAAVVGGFRLAERVLPPALDPHEVDRCRDSLQLLGERDERIREFEQKKGEREGLVQAAEELHDAIRKHEQSCGPLLRGLDKLG